MMENCFFGSMKSRKTMKISYKKLWHLLIDRDMTKTELQKAAGLSWGSVARLNRGENIGTDILLRVCKVLGCKLDDIMEIEEYSLQDEK